MERSETEARAVLSGRVQLHAEALVDLIRRVNPTGRVEAPAALKRRYRLKSALQSLLVRQCMAELEVRAESGQPGVVMLRYRYAEFGGACHAVLGELDEDARALIQRQLDTAGSAVAEALHRPAALAVAREPPRSGNYGTAAAETEGHLQLGQQAVAEYDYEAAGEHFRAAWEASRGAREAQHLLGLLVDHLAAYSDALALVPLLGREAAADREVRGLLAVAAARAHEPEMAWVWLREASAGRALEARLALIAAAIDGEDEDQAERLLAQTRTDWPAEPEVLRLAQALGRLRARRQLPLEEAAQAAVERGDADVAEQAARQILGLGLDSAVARRVLRTLEDTRRRKQASERSAAAEQALDQGLLAEAAELIQQAQALGASTEPLKERLDHAMAAEQRRRDQQRVDPLVLLLERDELRAGLLGYAALPERLRSQVRARSPCEALRWLDQIGPGELAARAPAAVEAVLALTAAQACLAEGEPEAALERLEPHEKNLAHVAQTRALRLSAQRQITERRRRSAAELLAAVAQAAQAADLASALGMLERVDIKALDEAERQQARQLGADLRGREAQLRRRTTLEEHLAAGRWLEAREAIDAWRGEPDGFEGSDDSERDLWQVHAAALERRIQAAWIIEAVDIPGDEPVSDLRIIGHWPPVHCGKPRVWLSSDGRMLLLPQVLERWIFLQYIDVGRGKPCRLVRLRMPEPLGGDPEIWLDRNSIWIAGDHAVLELSFDGLHVRRWRSIDALLGERRIVEQRELLPGPYLWLDKRRIDGEEHTQVIDLVRLRTRRELNETITFCALRGGAPGMVCIDYAGAGWLYTADGTRGDGPELPREELLRVAPHPSEPRLQIALLSAAVPGQGEPHLALVELGRRDAIWQVLSGTRAENYHALVTAHRERLVLLVATSAANSIELWAFAVEGERLVQRYRIPIPGTPLLIQDALAQHAYALMQSDTGCELVALGAAPPLFHRSPTEHERVTLPSSLFWPFLCDPRIKDTNAENRDALLAMLRMPAAERHRYVDRVLAAPETSAQTLDVLLRRLPGDIERSGFGRRAVERYPDDPLLLCHLVESLVVEQQWSEVSARLEGFGPARLPAPHIRHGYHLLGIARLHGGDIVGAEDAWQRGASHEGSCELGVCLNYLELLAEAEPDNSAAAEKNPLRRYIMAVRRAAACKRRGELAGMRAAVDCPEVQSINEIHGLALLAEAFLQPAPEPIDAVERFRRAWVLARLRELLSSPLGWCLLPIPDVPLHRARVMELAHEAERRLDEESGWNP